jgi:hypothetical protein
MSAQGSMILMNNNTMVQVFQCIFQKSIPLLNNNNLIEIKFHDPKVSNIWNYNATW